MRAVMRIVAGFFAVLWALFGFGLVDLAVTIAPDDLWRPVALLDGGWGLFVTAFIVAGLVLVTLRPVWATEIAGQLAGVAVVIAISAVIASEYTVWWMLAALLLPAGALAGLAATGRRRGSVAVARPEPVTRWARFAYLALFAVATPWLGYASEMYLANRQDRLPQEITNNVDHWAIQGAFAVTLVGFVALAVFRAQLHRFNAARAGVCAVYFGVCALRFPDSAGALPATWATLAVIWGVALILVAAAERRFATAGPE